MVIITIILMMYSHVSSVDPFNSVTCFCIHVFVGPCNSVTCVSTHVSPSVGPCNSVTCVSILTCLCPLVRVIPLLVFLYSRVSVRWSV